MFAGPDRDNGALSEPLHSDGIPASCPPFPQPRSDSQLGVREALNISIPCLPVFSLIQILNCFIELYIFFNFYFKKIILFLAALGLHCCMWAFSSCSEEGLFFVMAKYSFLSWWLLLLGSTGSGVLVHGLSCLTSYGIFLDQGAKLCPLHRGVGS